jgi:glycosyltransferase involved in cell wall biosynthesis
VKLLSIVIPTRNRPNELQSLLDVVTDLKSEEVEVIVSDNSDNPLQYGVRNTSIRFIRPSRVLNMTENWNFGLSQATGRYVTFLGDDDLVLPNELNALLGILRLELYDVVTTQTAGYLWPSGNESANFFSEIKKNNPKNHKAKVEKFNFSSLPVPYNNSLFAKSIIESYRKRTGLEDFLRSRIPDVEAGVKLSYLAKSFYHHPKIVFVSGTSPTSNGLLHRTAPKSPRSLEFSNPKLNPVQVNGINLEQFIAPFGFFTFYEAVSNALADLKVKSAVPDAIICFRATFGSFEPGIQLQINRVLWPNYILVSMVGAILGKFRKTHIAVKLLDFFNKAKLIVRVIFGRSRVVSIRGSQLLNTKELCFLLEKLEVQIYSNRLTRYHYSEARF